MMIFKLVDSLKYLTAVSHRAAASVAIRLREPGPTRAKGRFRQLEEVHCLEMVTFLVDAVVQGYLFLRHSAIGIDPHHLSVWLYRPYVRIWPEKNVL